MKFLCDQCKAKYQIADEKVQGKTLKMKCRKCGHIIEIRAAATETAGAGATMHLPALGEDDALASVTDGQSVAPPKPEHAAPKATIPRAPAAPTFGAPAAPRPGAPAAPRPGAPAATPRPAAAAPRPGAPAAKPEMSPRPGAAAPAAHAPHAPHGGALSSAFAKVSTKKDAEPPAQKKPEVPADEWYAAIDEVPVGPIRLSDLRAKYAEGALTDDSLVWREGFEEWRPLRTITDLHELVREDASHRSGASILPGAPRPSNRPAPTRPAGAVTPAPPQAAASRSNVIPFSPARGGAAAARKIDEEEFDDQEATRVALSPVDYPMPPAASASPAAAAPASGARASVLADPFGTSPAATAPAISDHRDSVHPAAHKKGISTGILALVGAACVLVGVVLAVVIVGKKEPRTVVQEKIIEREKPGEVVTVYLPSSNSPAPTVAAAPGSTTAAPTRVAAGAWTGGGTPPAGGATAPTAADTGAPVPPPPSADAPFSQAAAESVINGRKVGIRKKCIEPYADQGGSSVSVTVVIQPDGTVSSSSYNGNAAIGACVARMAKSFTFPKSGTGGTITFNLISS
jgi:predicted Zn finger-like uncharacterized protein